MNAGVIDELRRLGFTGSEAQVYIYLLQHPLATGYEVSKGTGLPRANTYQVLETLVTKEAIAPVSAEPLRYAPVPPERLLGRIKEETERRCDDLQEQLAQLTRPDGVEHFWELAERSRIEAHLAMLIGRARRRIAASLWADDVQMLAGALRAARDRGCTVILNLFGEAEVDFAAVYRHEEPEKVVGGHVVALTIDFEEAIVAALDEPATGVATQNRTLVRLVEKLIRDEAYLAAIYERFPDELETEFGPHLVGLRRRLLPDEESEQLLVVTSGASLNIHNVVRREQ